jgi:hypothetical protein
MASSFAVTDAGTRINRVHVDVDLSVIVIAHPGFTNIYYSSRLTFSDQRMCGPKGVNIARLRPTTGALIRKGNRRNPSIDATNLNIHHAPCDYAVPQADQTTCSASSDLVRLCSGSIHGNIQTRLVERDSVLPITIIKVLFLLR